ncbi:tetratricopeptide repeat protein [Streptomyces sp. URMC 129]|uniref:tetratricopeptide repeat protein n=1 Tax=Streptomyces sp. URMC 129 TaxID=3423407 RepID=UPI003F19FED4
MLGEARWTGQALADAVNRAGAETGTALRYDRTAVSHWLAGTKPPPAVGRLVAEVLSRRLGREVTLVETGLAHGPTGTRPADAPGAGAPATDPATALTELAGTPGARRRTPPDSAYSLAATHLPAFAALPPSAPAATPAAGERIGAAQVRLAAQMLQVFSDTDLTYGGGRARRALATFLGTDVARWLRAPAAGSARAGLLAGAADLAYLAGFMCFDETLNGTAQRYYTVAVRLAADAGDAERYAMALRAMSVQAQALGHHREALHLAGAAVASVSPDSPRTAFLVGQLAVASAAVGDRGAALRHLATAERNMGRAAPRTTGIGIYHEAALARQQAAALTHLGDLPGAADRLAFSLRHRPRGERRCRALTRAELAELRLRMGHVESACEQWRAFLVDYPLLSSGRADRALRDLRRGLRPYAASVPAARDLLARTSCGRRRTG